MKMIENDKMKIGGNTIKISIGNFLVYIAKLLSISGQNLLKFGESYAESGKPKYITNPSAKLFNPFLLVISFTFNNTEKYQLIQQGDYKQRYKESDEGKTDLSDEQLFMIIRQNQKQWFKKE